MKHKSTLLNTTAPPATIPIVPGVVMHNDGRDLFIIVNGVKVAKRGRPNSPEAGTMGSRLMVTTGVSRQILI